MNDLPTLSNRLWKRLHDASLLASITATSERQLGTGLTVALLPATRRMYHSDSDKGKVFLDQQAGFFGAHRDLLPLAVGAIAKTEIEESLDMVPSGTTRKIREWCSVQFQLLGIQLFHDGWRPLILLFGLILGLFVYGSTNLMRAVAVTLFLVVYNVPLWSFRLWSVRYGWNHGSQLPQAVAGWNLNCILHGIQVCGAFFTGVAFVLVSSEWGRIVFVRAAHAAEELAWISVSAGFLVGYLLIPRIPLFTILLLIISVVLSVAYIF